jgi:hypothetical protein
MRPPTASEISVIRWFAEQVEERQRQSLLSDLDKAAAIEIRDEQLAIRFVIDGYNASPDRFQRPLPIHAAVLDSDGATLDVELLTDPNGRLSGLDVFRYEAGPVLGPDWATLRVRRPDEVLTLNTPDNPLRLRSSERKP